MITIQFVVGTLVGQGRGAISYAVGETAGFPQDVAETLITQGRARRARFNEQPLVQLGLTSSEKEIKDRAEALAKLGRNLNEDVEIARKLSGLVEQYRSENKHLERSQTERHLETVQGRLNEAHTQADACAAFGRIV